MALIYKILTTTQWDAAQGAGMFLGAQIDLADGFIHFSDAATVRETAARHFARQENLVLVAVEAEDLGSNLRWEVSRGGALFPHLYAALDIRLVRWHCALPWSDAHGHLFPSDVP